MQINIANSDDADSSDASDVGLGRRKFLRTAAIVGVGAFLGSSVSAQALGIFAPRQSDAELLRAMNIPEEWTDRLGLTLPQYVAYLHRLKLRQIPIRAIIEPHLKERGPVKNSLPPKSLWRNMAVTLRTVDRMAVLMKEPIKEVVSAYRTPAYNARCGSRITSQHIKNTALDLKFHSSPRYVSKVARHLRDRGLFEGGVGSYSGFTHIDTRGKNADW